MARTSRSPRPHALRAAQAALPFLAAMVPAQRQYLLVYTTESDGAKIGSGAVLLPADEATTIEIREDIDTVSVGPGSDRRTAAPGLQVELTVAVTPDRTGTPVLAYAVDAACPACAEGWAGLSGPIRASARGRILGETVARIPLAFQNCRTAVVKLFVLEADNADLGEDVAMDL